MMKKVTYLMTILFAVALMSTSCCKEDPIVPDQTLEEQYPEWSNLSWVSTDGKDVNWQPLEDTYPRLKITIVGDELSVVQTMWNDVSETTYPLSSTYPAADVTITNVDVILAESAMNGEVSGTYSENGSEITLTTTGFTDDEHEYVLRIN